MSIRVGKVIAVKGVNITLKIDEQSSKETLFYLGKKYKGVSIREYVAIQRGFRQIVCVIQGEYLDENRLDYKTEHLQQYIRKVEASPIGYFEVDQFIQGIKYLPMIKDSAFLLQEEQIRAIFTRSLHNSQTDSEMSIGKLLQENIPIDLPWTKLFNSHIGIFGNTGSGKSNTLAKLFTTLFDKKIEHIRGKSQFIVLDFNGEYTGDQLTSQQDKIVYRLSTSDSSKVSQNQKFPLAENQFWNIETLSILFKATTNTQRPFLDRVIANRKKYLQNKDNQTSVKDYTESIITRVFTTTNPQAEMLELIQQVLKKMDKNPEAENLLTKQINQIAWHSGTRKFYIKDQKDDYFNGGDNCSSFANYIEPKLTTLKFNELNDFEELLVRCYLRLTGDLLGNFVQFDHINPLIKRIESSILSLQKTLDIQKQGKKRKKEKANHKTVTVISLRDCNNDIKKILPLLLAKHYYYQQKETVEIPPQHTTHLIIDEAHNILSEQSNREDVTWKDYRLEQFEEIIKEGRKFGMFVTIASQRPADISPTIVSQLHNFFIHRLVNDRDLFLLKNTITTLDMLSREQIPSFAQGCCVATGTAFPLPMIIQVDQLDSHRTPDSEDINLKTLWKTD